MKTTIIVPSQLSITAVETAIREVNDTFPQLEVVQRPECVGHNHLVILPTNTPERKMDVVYSTTSIDIECPVETELCKIVALLIQENLSMKMATTATA